MKFYILVLAVQIIAAELIPSLAADRTSADLKHPGIKVEKNVAYLAEGQTETADLYLPTGPEYPSPWPAMVVIHGGGWDSGQRNAGREINIGTTLASHGYVVMSIDYILSQGKYVVWPTNLWDCKTAVRWLRKNARPLGVDPDRIGVMGGSAGGHLAAMVALTRPGDGLDPAGPYAEYSCAVRCCIDMYGIADVAAFDGYVSMLGKRAADAPDLFRRASPISYVRSDSPPFLILHGTADKLVSLDQSKLLAATLEKAGVEHQLVIVPGAPHTFDLQPVQQDLRPVVLTFLEKYLKNAK